MRSYNDFSNLPQVLVYGATRQQVSLTEEDAHGYPICTCTRTGAGLLTGMGELYVGVLAGCQDFGVATILGE
jgi:hypothetical protein